MIVVDASVIANALADDTTDGDATRYELRTGGDLAAPDLVDVETLSVLRKRWMAGDLTARRFRMAIDDLADLDMKRYPTLPLAVRSYELRSNLTPYDAVYVALAEALTCTLVTADTRVANAPGPRCPIRLVR